MVGLLGHRKQARVAEYRSLDVQRKIESALQKRRGLPMTAEARTEVDSSRRGYVLRYRATRRRKRCQAERSREVGRGCVSP